MSLQYASGVSDIRDDLRILFRTGKFEVDRTGCRTVELINAVFDATEPTILGEVNEEYVQRELIWYQSQSLNVNDIPGPTPKIWQSVADTCGHINSNYGWCIWSADNHNQYNSALSELLKNKSSRRAIMIYTRPSMQVDFNKNGMQDFMCTNSVGLFIRGDFLYYVVDQRSCDAWAGYRNDCAWHRYVYDMLFNDLKPSYPDLQTYPVIFKVGSLHVYERQFYLLDHYDQTGQIHISKLDYQELYPSSPWA
jgi:thymidylate synthase